MAHRVTLIPGDGIGPEVTEAVLRILGDPDFARCLRDTAAERVRRCFGREQSVARIEALYRELVQEG